jgi:hypothetical protein
MKYKSSLYSFGPELDWLPVLECAAHLLIYRQVPYACLQRVFFEVKYSLLRRRCAPTRAISSATERLGYIIIRA